jgi:hypothetical protein
VDRLLGADLSSWYELEMAPEIYWQMFSDALIRRIHQRVLEHIKREVEWFRVPGCGDDTMGGGLCHHPR